MKKDTLTLKGLLLPIMTAGIIGSGSVQAMSVEVLSDGGFESSVSSSGSSHVLSWDSSAYGTWGVGDTFSIVGSDNGINPLEGSSMLAFNTSSSSSLDIYQIIDVSSFASEIDSGIVSADLTAYFNSTSSSSFGLRLLGWNNAPTSFSEIQLIDGVVSGLNTDSDIQTWEEFNLSAFIPTGTRYLAFGMHEPRGSPTAYADNTSLMLNIASVPEPNTLSLLALGMIGAGIARRKMAK